GFALKERLKRELQRLGHDVGGVGTDSDRPGDYPRFFLPGGALGAQGRADRGIVLGGSGIGECIAANKVRGVRAALVTSEETARLTRLHNDSNVLALGGRTNRDHDAVAGWMRVWLETPFEGGRHLPRLEKIRSYED